jgi:hypothetical protein
MVALFNYVTGYMVSSADVKDIVTGSPASNNSV